MTLGSFIVFGRPVPKARPRMAKNGHVYTPKRTIEYENTVAWYAIKSGLRLKAGMRVAVEVVCYLHRKPWPDADNLLKTALDGLQRGYPEWNDRDVVKAGVELEGCEKDFERALIVVREAG